MLTTSLGHLPRWAGRVRHGDGIVRGVMSNDADRSDNYLLYMAGQPVERSVASE